MYAHCGSSLSLRSSTSHLHVSCALWALLLISSTSPFTSSLPSSSLLSPCCSCCPTSSTSLMSWINTLRTSAEDHGTLAKNDSSTGYQPNDHFITEAGVFKRAAVPWWLRLRWRHHRSDAPQCVPKTSRSLWRRRLVVLSVVVSQVKPVVCRLVSSAQKTQRHNSENEQIRTLLERQRSRFSQTVKQRFENTKDRGEVHRDG